MTSETQRNFDDFNNMFKGIDRKDRVPDDIASIVLEKVRRECNPSRLDDVVEWFDGSHFYKIRYWVDDTSAYESDVSDIED